MEQLTAVELPQHVEDAGNFSANGGFRPSRTVALKKSAEVAMFRVFEHEAVEKLPVVENEQKRVENTNRPRMAVKQLSEIRLTQPAVNPAAGFDTHHVGHCRRPAKTTCEIHLAKTAPSKQLADLESKSRFGTDDRLAWIEELRLRLWTAEYRSRGRSCQEIVRLRARRHEASAYQPDSSG
jgi:hypothetical protein